MKYKPWFKLLCRYILRRRVRLKAVYLESFNRDIQ